MKSISKYLLGILAGSGIIMACSVMWPSIFDSYNKGYHEGYLDMYEIANQYLYEDNSMKTVLWTSVGKHYADSAYETAL